MAHCVFMHKADSIYDDIPAERYQFPAQYLARELDEAAEPAATGPLSRDVSPAPRIEPGGRLAGLARLFD